MNKIKELQKKLNEMKNNNSNNNGDNSTNPKSQQSQNKQKINSNMNSDETNKISEKNNSTQNTEPNKSSTKQQKVNSQQKQDINKATQQKSNTITKNNNRGSTIKPSKTPPQESTTKTNSNSNHNSDKSNQTTQTKKKVKTNNMSKPSKPNKTSSQKTNKPNTSKDSNKTFIELPKHIEIGKFKIKTRLLLTLGYILIGLLISGGVLTYLYFVLIDIQPPAKSLIKINSEYIFPEKNLTPTFNTHYTIAQPSIPRTKESPLNGKLFTKNEMEKLEKRRPIAIMINNHSWARPQSNLTKADMVYETLVEAGITRYLAFYWSEDVQEVGPIRSIRNYHLEMLSGYDAILAHDGQAHADDPRVDAAGNIHRYKIKDVNTYGAWRWNDGRRYAPHNEYTNPMKIWDFAKQQGWNNLPDFSSWRFKKDASITDRAEESIVEISFWKWVTNGNNYNVVWKYDKISNTYYREIGGKKDIDQKTKKQINPKVVIIQEVEMISTGNSKGHIIIETVGDGNAKILQDGKVHEATWKKSSRTTRTKYYDQEGNEFQFNRGQIWIQALPEKNGKFTIIK